MSTLRTKQFMSVASLAAQHLAEKSARVAAMYAGDDSPLTVAVEDIHKEMQETGHAYDPNCQRPTCVKVRQMWATAVQQVMSQGAQ